MIKILFVALAAVHGLIHLIGFVKAFRLVEVSQLTRSISRPAGVLWLLSAVLFLAAAASLAFGIRIWWIPGAAGLVLSQVLIILSWSDAKFGTLVNVIMLAAVVLGYGTWSFDSASRKELGALLGSELSQGEIVSEERLARLPQSVQRWLRSANVVGKRPAPTVHLHQKGSLRTSPDGSWMPFEAEQWFTSGKPGFVWLADVSAGPGLFLAGRDTYLDGRGHMVIKMMSLVTVADARGVQIDQGAMIRFLAELCWFPGAALSPYVEWEGIDSLSARATMTYGGITGSGVFTFDDRGDMLRFESSRYYGSGDTSTLERWVVETEPGGTGEFEGVRMPVRSAVTWGLDEGPFTWFRLEITDLTSENGQNP